MFRVFITKVKKGQGIMNKAADNIILFRNLVSEIDISKYDQTGYVSVVNSIYYNIFIDQEEE